MDPQVLAALARWPDVPAVFGWLRLSARGEWLLRGERIGNPALREYIGRNYAGDGAGRWYFQNGPQRVYVALEATPWVARLTPAGVLTHLGAAVRECRAAQQLDDGRVLLVTELGATLVDDRDTLALAAALHQDGAVLEPALLGLHGAPLALAYATLDECARRFGFARDPEPD